jgi:hypothetical protein
VEVDKQLAIREEVLLLGTVGDDRSGAITEATCKGELAR